MAKLKSKVTKEQVAKGAARDFDEPKPGRYKAEVHTCEVEGKKANKKVKQLHLAYQIVDHDKFGGSVVHERVPLPPELDGDMHERSEWKYSQFLQAMQLIDATSKKKTHTVEFDTDDLVGTPVLVRIKAGDYEGDYRAEVGTVLPRFEDDDDDADTDDAEEVDEDELDEDDDEFGEDDDGEEEEDDEEEEELTADDINGMDAEELKALMAEYELKKPKDVKGIKGVRAWLIEELELEGDEDEDDPF